MSPAAWAAHRRAIQDASQWDDQCKIEEARQAIRDLVKRLEIAASVGSQEARQRLQRLRLNPVGAVAASAADEALRRLDKQLMKGSMN